jgi:hypothetical protein
MCMLPMIVPLPYTAVGACLKQHGAELALHAAGTHIAAPRKSDTQTEYAVFPSSSSTASPSWLTFDRPIHLSTSVHVMCCVHASWCAEDATSTQHFTSYVPRTKTRIAADTIWRLPVASLLPCHSRGDARGLAGYTTPAGAASGVLLNLNPGRRERALGDQGTGLCRYVACAVPFHSFLARAQ